MTVNFTETFVRQLIWSGKPREFRDKQVAGLILYVGKERKTYSWKCELHDVDTEGNKTKRYIKGLIGSTKEVSLDEARRSAVISISTAKEDHRLGRVRKKSIVTVNEMLLIYANDLERRGKSKRTAEKVFPDILRMYPKWMEREARTLSRSEIAAGHKRVSEENGPVSANHVMRTLRAAYNVLLKILPDEEYFTNPVASLRLNKETPRRNVVSNLTDWYSRLHRVGNPIRFNALLFGILSGLRPTNRNEIRIDWIDLNAPEIHFPASVMKN